MENNDYTFEVPESVVTYCYEHPRVLGEEVETTEQIKEGIVQRAKPFIERRSKVRQETLEHAKDKVS